MSELSRVASEWSANILEESYTLLPLLLLLKPATATSLSNYEEANVCYFE